MPIAPPDTRDKQIQFIAHYIYNQLSLKYGAATGTQYENSFIDYANKHPKLSADQAYLAWFIVAGNLTSNLAKDVSVAATTPANVASDIPKGVQALSPTAAIEKIFSALTNRAFVIRLAEGILGVLLILAGVAKLAEGTPAATAIRKVPFI